MRKTLLGDGHKNIVFNSTILSHDSSWKGTEPTLKTRATTSLGT